MNYVDEDDYYYNNSWEDYDGYDDAYYADYGYWEYGDTECDYAEDAYEHDEDEYEVPCELDALSGG